MRKDQTDASQQYVTQTHSDSQALTIKSKFCPATVSDPFTTLQWELRDCSIQDENGEAIFEQTACEFPSSWSQLASNVVSSKYFHGEKGSPNRETSLKQLIHRVTHTITDWGLEDGYFHSSEDANNFYNDLTWLCLHQYGSFNSPVWFNVGLWNQYQTEAETSNWYYNETTNSAEECQNAYEHPQCSACFIQSVQDDMNSIMGLAKNEAMLFKFGSGTGTDLSTIRSLREELSGGGKPSGPLSFMRVYDQIAAVVKSGGKTRRAAKMQSLKDWHPDILEFIEAKSLEEKKAKTLIANGYEANFNGDAYSSVMYQNSNLSVRLSDEFLQSVSNDEVWQTRFVNDPSTPGPSYPARELFEKIAQCAWECGDPGVQFDSTINQWHTCPNSGRINASNPCSEYMFLDDSACNLASLNLIKFQKPDGSFDAKRFSAACRIFIIAQEILVTRASYPTAKITENSYRYRPLGLGYSNLGSYLMSLGLAYDSPQARSLCACITAIMHGAANLTSSEMAKVKGPFSGYAKNETPFWKVIQKHADSIQEISKNHFPKLRKFAKKLWQEVIQTGQENGFRNSQVTVLAPTGTISFMMDCDTTGIEPEIALVRYKQLAGRGMMRLVNRTVSSALQHLGYKKKQINQLIQFADENGTLEGSTLKPEHLPVFDTSFPTGDSQRSIHWKAHVKMMAAAQPFLSGAISKTVNMPSDSQPENIAEAYMLGWKLGLKAIAIYRDGSKGSQPVSTSQESEETNIGNQASDRRKRLPDTRESLTHKFSVAGHEGYITVGKYANGTPGELFITMAKEGSTIGGLMDCIGTSISIGLQYGVPLEVYAAKFKNMQFEPMGITSNSEIRLAKSVVDYIFRWLEMEFVEEGKSNTENNVDSKAEKTISEHETDAPLCPDCGSITIRAGACYLCHQCGTSLGCS